ncbi:ABC transporter permease subunit [Ovoidimarina sediminis]|uniref:ABC transporter permease subunit n=1 Tax=Ovoidimarina sediminis TaxID=3079856 RepID=UPI0029069501|nr:ABC transporter permease subunit [Rhodophyticola sp. MJ-SS7]MDU8942674.1 ABC transporter permease subunit [Rhodophyticola sp. MJ-SS7]
MRRILDHAVLMGGVLLFCGPVLLLAVSATHDGGLNRAGGLTLWPGTGFGANLDRLREVGGGAARMPGVNAMIWSSAAVGLGVALLTTAVSFVAAYAITHLRGRGTQAVFWVSVATLYFPVEARMLPTFEITAGLGLLGTTLGMVLPILPLALGTLIFRQHLKTLPPELMEAARLDGAGPLRFLRDFALPLSGPPIGAVLLITFIFGWNQYLWPLLISIDGSVWTLMRGLGFLGSGSGPATALAALSMLPPLLLAIGFARLLSRLGQLRL